MYNLIHFFKIDTTKLKVSRNSLNLFQRKVCAFCYKKSSSNIAAIFVVINLLLITRFTDISFSSVRVKSSQKFEHKNCVAEAENEFFLAMLKLVFRKERDKNENENQNLSVYKSSF